MQIKKKVLLDALEIVKPGLANREMIEQSTSFAFMKGRVVTYNDEISISAPVEGLEIEGAVKADQLYQLLGKIKTEDIDIAIAGNEIRIRAGKSRAGLVMQSEVKLPLDELGKIGKFKPLPKTFVQHVKFVLPSCSRDMSNAMLTGINIQEDGTIIASDGLRITRCVGEPSPVPTFLLPGTSAQDLIKYEVTMISPGEGWMHFRTESGTVFSCRVYGERFPKIEQYLEVKGSKIHLPKTLQEILDRASIFSKREHSLDEEVLVSLEAEKIKVRGAGDAGWYEENAQAKYSDSPVTFAIHPGFLKEIVTRVRSCILGETCMRFAGDDWVHIVALSQKEK